MNLLIEYLKKIEGKVTIDFDGNVVIITNKDTQEDMLIDELIRRVMVIDDAASYDAATLDEELLGEAMDEWEENLE